MAVPTMGSIPPIETRIEGTEAPILVQVISSVDNDHMSSPLRKERSKEFLEYAVDDSASSSGEEEISIHVEGPGSHDHDQSESLSSSALTASTQPETDLTATEEFDPSSSLRRSRVRFRSRVRITSGLHGHHHSHHRRVSQSSTNSLSDSSRSSSISAPLRSSLTEADCTPGWGTLGQRVNLFAVENRNRQAAEALRNGNAKHRARRRPSVPAGNPPTERTALLRERQLRPPSYNSDAHYADSECSASEDGEYDDADGEALLSRQIDRVFGKWPGRLLNRHWWWWQLQPILCCGCLDESDAES